jgi:hypothetical protein
VSEANRAGKSDRAEIRAGKIEFGCSNFEGDLPFRGEAQNCVTVKFLLVSPTYERGLELSLIRFPSGVGRTRHQPKSFYIADALGTDVVFCYNSMSKLLRSRVECFEGALHCFLLFVGVRGRRIAN